MVLVTSRITALAEKKTIKLTEVAKLPLALPFSGFSTVQFFTETFSEHELEPNICMEINDIPTLFEMVKTGQWHTILSHTSVNDPEVIGISIEGRNMKRDISIISSNEAYENRAMSTFCELLMGMDYV